MVDYFSPEKTKTYSANCITGDDVHLYTFLQKAILSAKKIDIIVAFLMESGVRLLIDDLRRAIDNGALVRILCGNYLNITQPEALYLLRGTFGEKIDLRFYNKPNKSLHPKAYIFEFETEGEIFIGSSNISLSALTTGIEWNYRFNSLTNPGDFKHFKNTFVDLFFNQSIIVDDKEMRNYSKGWKRSKVYDNFENMENTIKQIENSNYPKASTAMAPFSINDHGQSSATGEVVNLFRPRGPQIEALYELEKARMVGWDKGLVVAATGIGKTFLAAFDSIIFDRILFVAHREEILRQAEDTFRKVRPTIKIGYFSGTQKDTKSALLLATVQSLGKDEYLRRDIFTKDQFDYIIIDEFHHAAAESYKNIISYFTPKFLLGLTATPERLDNQDVFALCDYNLVYEIRLKEAINKGWLVPFRYYGVYDNTTDFDEIKYEMGRYNEAQLEEALAINKRAELILQHYLKFNSLRALGFCVSRRHAVFMANYFNEHGIKACAVISGGGLNGNNATDRQKNSFILDRKLAIDKLKETKTNIVFSVDMFNEGLDVPEIDMVLFLRPTESPVVFLQQLGRGLRKTKDKKYVNVLDFIGNYKKANFIPFFLTGELKTYEKFAKANYLPREEEFPDDCFVDFDFRLIDLFKRMASKEKSLADKIQDEFIRIEGDLQKRPLRQDMYTYLDEVVLLAIRKRKDFNIFRDYLTFLNNIGRLTIEEQSLLGTKGHEFLKEIENTSMTKMYKMPVLLAFYNHGEIKLTITEDDLYESLKDFYSYASNAVDMLRDNSTNNFKDWGKKEYTNLAFKNPVHFLAKSSPEFFYRENNSFCLNSSLQNYLIDPAFVEHFKDIIDYRTRRFYKERLEKYL